MDETEACDHSRSGWSSARARTYLTTTWSIETSLRAGSLLGLGDAKLTFVFKESVLWGGQTHQGHRVTHALVVGTPQRE